MTDTTRDLPDEELDAEAEKAWAELVEDLTAPKRKKDESQWP